jgi:hypothetical protein
VPLPKLDLRQTSQAVAWRLASLLKLLQHVAWLHVAAAPQTGDSPSEYKNLPNSDCTQPKAHAQIFLAFA